MPTDACGEPALGVWRPVHPEPAQTASPSRTLHQFSSEWYERRRHEVQPRTAEHWKWALSNHLLPVLGDYELGDIGPEQVDMFKSVKLKERAIYERASEREREQLARPLSSATSTPWPSLVTLGPS
jgi:hypothetical protein